MFRYQTHLRSIYASSSQSVAAISVGRSAADTTLSGTKPAVRNKSCGWRGFARKVKVFDVFWEGKAAILNHVGRHHVQMYAQR